MYGVKGKRCVIQLLLCVVSKFSIVKMEAREFLNGEGCIAGDDYLVEGNDVLSYEGNIGLKSKHKEVVVNNKCLFVDLVKKYYPKMEEWGRMSIGEIYVILKENRMKRDYLLAEYLERFVEDQKLYCESINMCDLERKMKMADLMGRVGEFDAEYFFLIRVHSKACCLATKNGEFKVYQFVV